MCVHGMGSMNTIDINYYIIACNNIIMDGKD